MFKYEINDYIFYLIDGKIVEGLIKERRFIESAAGYHIVYSVDFCSPEEGHLNQSIYEGEAFASPDELVLNLLDIYYLNKDDLE